MRDGNVPTPVIRRIVAFRRCERGSNVVEFALLSPVLIVLVLGIVFTSTVIGIQHAVERMSFQAARYAMVGHDGTERADLVRRWLDRQGAEASILDLDKLEYEVREAPGEMTVLVAYDVSDLPIPAMLASAFRMGPAIVSESRVVLP